MSIVKMLTTREDIMFKNSMSAVWAHFAGGNFGLAHLLIEQTRDMGWESVFEIFKPASAKLNTDEKIELLK